MPHIAGPNHTQIPNVILDSMDALGNAELRVVLAVCRKTFGWQKRQDLLSLTQLQELTDLSRQGTIDGINSAIEHGWIVRKPKGRSFVYSVNLVDQSGGQASRPKVVNQVDQPEEKIVKQVDIQKKELPKERIKEKNTAPTPRGNPALYSLALAMAEVCHVNFEASKGRMMKEAKLLSAALPVPTPELIKANYNGDPRAFWKAHDWRGKKGQFPTPSAIRETWGQWNVSIESGGNQRMTVAQQELQRIQNGESENDILGIFSNL